VVGPKTDETRLRILALTPTFAPLVGGVETALLKLFSGLAGRGHTIDVITPHLAGPRRETIGEGLHVVRVGRPLRSRPAKFLAYQWWQARALRRLHRERPYDIAVLTYGVHASLLQPWIQRTLKIPVVVAEIHLGTGAEITKDSENPAILAPLLKASYRAADAVIAQSRETGRFIEATSGRTDWNLIPQGSDPTVFHPAKRSAAVRATFGTPKHLLATASRLSARKNLGDALVALRLVLRKHPGTHLVVAGDGPERASLEATAASMGLAKHVTFTGYLANEDLAALLASADAFLSTARYEAFGLSIVDAMASGIPVVAYDARGPNDFLRDGEAGFVTPQDPDRLAESIGRILDSPGEAREMGARGRALVEKTFNWNANVDAHEALLLRIAAAVHGRG
jgi:glycogen(starch) synthase